MITLRSISGIVPTLLLLVLLLSRSANADGTGASSTTYDIVFIGDSITHGAGTAQPATQAAPVICAQQLQQAISGATVNVLNQGYVGYTALGISHQIHGIEKQVAPFLAAHPGGQVVFSIMLGTNDSANSGPTGCPTAAADYRTNLKAVVDEILTQYAGAKVFLNCPIFYSPNTVKKGADYGGDSAANRLKSYFPEISGLVTDYAASHPNQVFAGDTKAYDYFAANYLTDIAPEHGLQGVFYLHPNAKGAASLGKFWAEAMAPNLGH